MKVADLVRWKKSLNEVRYLHEELEIAKELASIGNAEFQNYIRKYCEKNGIKLDTVTRQFPDQQPQQAENEEKQEENDFTLSTEFDFISDEQETATVEIEKDYKQELKEIFSKLFKKLAVHLHPDKVANLSEKEREQRLAMFRKAKTALDKGDYFILLDMSDTFEIRTPNNYKQQTRWMKDRIVEIKILVDAEKTTYNYLFAEADSEEKKETLAKSFIKQVLGVKTV